MQAKNCLTIRDDQGAQIGEAYVGSQAMTFRKRTAKVVDLRTSLVDQWISHRLQQCETQQRQEEFLAQVVTVADEYRY